MLLSDLPGKEKHKTFDIYIFMTSLSITDESLNNYDPLFCNMFSSLSDRKPVESEDEIIVMLVPDYQMLQYVQKIASDLSDDSVFT